MGTMPGFLGAGNAYMAIGAKRPLNRFGWILVLRFPPVPSQEPGGSSITSGWALVSATVPIPLASPLGVVNYHHPPPLSQPPLSQCRVPWVRFTSSGPRPLQRIYSRDGPKYQESYP